MLVVNWLSARNAESFGYRQLHLVFKFYFPFFLVVYNEKI